MKKFAPRLAQLREKHGDDKAGMQKAMMDLYKKEGFNPFDMMIGCLPLLLVQTPAFMALYWVLQGRVELRLQQFMLWIYNQIKL